MVAAILLALVLAIIAVVLGIVAHPLFFLLLIGLVLVFFVARAA